MSVAFLKFFLCKIIYSLEGDGVEEFQDGYLVHGHH